MTNEDELQTWIAKRIRDLEGQRIWWTGRDGRPAHVKLQLKEVELSAKPSGPGLGGGPSLSESSTIKFVPATRHEADEEPDEIDSIAEQILAADSNRARSEEIDKLWGKLIGAVGDDCNVIPGIPEAPCKERLIVFPELVSVLARHRLLPNALDFCGIDLQLLTKRETGICCALCEATRHAQQCFSRPNWMNRVIDIRGDYLRIRRARPPSRLCNNWWREEDALAVRPNIRALRPSVRSVDGIDEDPETAVLGKDTRERRITCWEYFIEAIGRLRALGGPSNCPEVLLAGRRVRVR